jgi:hypothetical protein
MALLSSASSTGVAALYCLFGDMTWLPYSYESVYPCVDKIFLFLSQSPWYGNERRSEVDRELLDRLPDPLQKKEIITGDWKNEPEQRNITLAYAQATGYTYGFIVDADEVYESSQLSQAISFAQSKPEVSVWHVNWFTYWKSPLFRIDPIEPYQPAILVQLGKAGFVETRNPIGDKHDLIPPEICMCHHLSYALSDEALMKKHIMQPGHSQSAYPGWLENKWQAWDGDHGIGELHPVNPAWYARAVPQPRDLQPLALRRTSSQD